MGWASMRCLRWGWRGIDLRVAGELLHTSPVREVYGYLCFYFDWFAVYQIWLIGPLPHRIHYGLTEYLRPRHPVQLDHFAGCVDDGMQHDRSDFVSYCRFWIFWDLLRLGQSKHNARRHPDAFYRCGSAPRIADCDRCVH